MTFPTTVDAITHLENPEQYIAHPDRIVRDLFKNHEDARVFFKTYLPGDVVKILDLDRLSYLPESYIDPKFKEHRSDILFDIPTQSSHPTKISLIFEHKIQPEEDNFTQILRYLSVIYGQQLELVPVIPFLFYHKHGKITPRRFSGIFKLRPDDMNWEEILSSTKEVFKGQKGIDKRHLYQILRRSFLRHISRPYHQIYSLNNFSDSLSG